MDYERAKIGEKTKRNERARAQTLTGLGPYFIDSM